MQPKAILPFLVFNFLLLFQIPISAASNHANREVILNSEPEANLEDLLNNTLEDTCGMISVNTWIGGVSNDWHVASNWSLGHVPNDCERVIIQNDSVIIPNGAFYAQSMLLDNAILNLGEFSSRLYVNGNGLGNHGVELINNSHLINENWLEIAHTGASAQGIWLRDGRITNHGWIRIENLEGSFSYGVYIDGSSEFINALYGDIWIDSLEAPGIAVATNATLYNEGDIDIWNSEATWAVLNLGKIMNNYEYADFKIWNSSGGGIYSFGLIENQGDIIIEECGSYGINQNASAALINDGSIRIDDTGAESILSAGSSVISGTGDLIVDTSCLQYAKLNPGRSPGVLTIIGDLIHNSGSIDTFELAGPGEPGDSLGYDLVHVQGNLHLNGKLVIKLLNGYVPADEEAFRLFTFTDSLSGTFSTIELPPALADWYLDFTYPDRVILRKIACDYGINTFIGGNSKWNIASNWSLGHIPLSCEEVVINPLDTVLIASGFDAEAYTVLVDTGALLSIASDGSLTMDIEDYQRNGLWIRSGTVENHGEIDITDMYNRPGLYISRDEGTFDNFGTVGISDSEVSDAFANYGIFTNYSSGQLNVSNPQLNIFNDLSNIAMFTNYGAINLENIGGITNRGYGTIFLNHGTIISEQSGEIHNDLSAEFHNYGSISCTDVQTGFSNYAAIDNESEFVNHVGGMIELRNVLNNARAVGIHNARYYLFINDGHILIDSVASNGIYNERNFSVGQFGVFTNNGTIEATATDLQPHPSAEVASIRNRRGNILRGSGTLILENRLRNEYILSPGSSIGSHQIFGNLFHSNTAIDSLEIAGTLGGGNPAGHDSIYVSGNVHFNGNSKLRINFLNGYLPAVTDTFTILEYGGNRTGMPKVQFPLGIAGFVADFSEPGQIRVYRKSCTPATNQWIGGTGMWDDPTGWSLGHVPEYCEDVLLSTGDSVTIPASFRAEVRSMQNTSGTLVVEPGAVLLVDVNYEAKVALRNTSDGSIINDGSMILARTDGFNASGLTNINGSSIINSGTITINDINELSSEGLVNLANFINTGSITVSEVERSFGLFHSVTGSVFDNSGSIIISGIGSTGMRVQSGAHFVNSGMVEIEDCTGYTLSVVSGGDLEVTGSGEVQLYDQN